MSAHDHYLPPVNTTSAVLQFNPEHGIPAEPDMVFTVRGIRTGKWLGSWIRVLVEEHATDQLDATIQVWHHHPSGEFTPTEITHCAS